MTNIKEVDGQRRALALDIFTLDAGRLSLYVLVFVSATDRLPAGVACELSVIRAVSVF
jgi:hypothetical protein